MLYRIKLTQTIERTIVINATDDDDANRQINWEKGCPNYDSKCLFLNTEINDNSWVYDDHDTFPITDTLIQTPADLLDTQGMDSIEKLNLYLFKFSKSGISIYVDRENHGIILTGCVEGSDCDGPSEFLKFPFFLSEYNTACEKVDTLSCEAWEELHGEEE